MTDNVNNENKNNVETEKGSALKSWVRNNKTRLIYYSGGVLTGMTAMFLMTRTNEVEFEEDYEIEEDED